MIPAREHSLDAVHGRDNFVAGHTFDKIGDMSERNVGEALSEPKKLIREPFYSQAAKSAKDLQQKQESLVW